MENKSFLEDPIVKAKLRFLKEMRLSYSYKRFNRKHCWYKPCEDLVDPPSSICHFGPIESSDVDIYNSRSISIHSAFLVWLMSFRIVPIRKDSAIVRAADHYAAQFEHEFFPYSLVPKTEWRRTADWLYKRKHLITKRQHRFLKLPIITMLQIFVEHIILRYKDYK